MPTEAATPIVAPDLIAFLSDREGPLGIYLMAADGSGSEVLLSIHP